MSLTITKNYSRGQVLTQAELDAAFADIETKFNTTLIASSEIQDGGIAAANIAAGAVTSAKLDTNISVSGSLTVGGAAVLTASAAKQLKADGQMVVVSENTASNQLKMIRGGVQSSGGTLLYGEGFSVSKSGTGTFVVTFTTAFSATPVVVGSVVTGSLATYILVCSAVSTTQFTVGIINSSTVAVDQDFMFIAIGIKA